jgi:copper homeostasis protein
MQVNPKIEICCYSLEDTLNAAEGGAHQIELCSNRFEGGVTPSIGLVKQCLDSIPIPITVIIRPRGGLFHYSDEEWRCMKYDIAACQDLGIRSFSIGMLNATNTRPDIQKLEELSTLASDQKLIFHKAFDCLEDQKESIRILKAMGFDSFMTSGKKATAAEGLSELISLKKLADAHGIEVIAAGGIRHDSLVTLLQANCAHIYHSGIKSHDRNEIDLYGIETGFTEHDVRELMRGYLSLHEGEKD